MSNVPDQSLQVQSPGNLSPAMATVYSTVVGDGGALYCSAPVTSGRRYIDWLERTGKNLTDIDNADKQHKAAHFAEVVRPNCAHAARIVREVRDVTQQVVIDPTAMPYMPGWVQADWRAFWREVIERHASAALFVEDWQYSNGCAYEFLVAHSIGLPTMDEKMNSLDLERGIGLISQASAEMRRLGASTTFLEQVLNDLEELRLARPGMGAT